MKAFFRYMLSVYVRAYQRTGGRIGGSVGGYPVLLLNTTGKKTGRARTTPLDYFNYDGEYVVTGANSGEAADPASYYNVKSQPQVHVQIGHEKLAARAEVAGPALRHQLWARLMQLAPRSGDLAKNTTREFPIVLLRPA
jgi:F420H(2)-dependent quinone reductase